MIFLVSLATLTVFLLGELPFAGYLARYSFAKVNLLDFHFLLFVITRVVGISGQIYLWSNAELGRVSALMGITGVLLSNLFGIYVLDQSHFTIRGYIGLLLALVSIVLLTVSK